MIGSFPHLEPSHLINSADRCSCHILLKRLDEPSAKTKNQNKQTTNHSNHKAILPDTSHCSSVRILEHSQLLADYHLPLLISKVFALKPWESWDEAVPLDSLIISQVRTRPFFFFFYGQHATSHTLHRAALTTIMVFSFIHLYMHLPRSLLVRLFHASIGNC